MSTTLYLRFAPDTSRDALISLIGKSHSQALGRSGANNPISFATLALLTTIGSSASSLSGNALATTTHQDGIMGLWISDALDIQDIPAGTWDFAASVNSGGAVHGPDANSFFGLSIYIWRPLSTSNLGGPGQAIRILDADGIGDEWTFGAGQLAPRILFSAPAIPGIFWGDRLVVETWYHAVPASAFANPQTLYFGGGTDVVASPATADPASRLIVPANLVFSAAGSPDPLAYSGRVQGKRMMRERWFTCAIGGERVPESETTIPIAPHPQAGLRVCRRDYDELDYGTKRTMTPPPTGENETDTQGDF